MVRGQRRTCLDARRANLSRNLLQDLRDPPLLLVLTNTTSSASVGRGRPPTICIMVRYRALRCEYLLSAPDSADCTCATRTQNPSPRSDAVGNTANTTSTCPPRTIPQRQPSHAPYPRCGHGHGHGQPETTDRDPGTQMAFIVCQEHRCLE